jgi:hypothetical protein
MSRCCASGTALGAALGAAVLACSAAASAGIARRAALVAAVLACAATAAAPAPWDVLGSASDWVAGASDQVQSRLRAVDGPHGAGICLDFDFGGVAGFVSARRALALELPPDFDFDLELRGESAGHDFQVKLIDASGENIWWYRRPEFDFPLAWQPLRIRKWQIKFAGDSKLDRPLRQAAAIELALSKGTGAARGSVCVDRFDLLERPVAREPPGPPRVTGSSPADSPASALDAQGRLQPPWTSDPAREPRQRLSIDLGRTREFGGVFLQWARGEQATGYDVRLSGDGEHWLTVREVAGAAGPDQFVPLPEAEARYLRLELHEGAARRVRLIGLQIEDPESGTDWNRVIELLAARSPRGRYPRSFGSEQSYWTVVGTGSGSPSLLSEDGALQVGKNGYTVEPFLLAPEGLIGWADVEAEQSLQDGYLPMPQVQWRARALTLRVRAFAIVEAGRSSVVVRYTVGNRSAAAARLKLALAVRPLQVDPPTQFLNSPGGVHPIHDLAWDGDVVTVDAQPGIRALGRPAAFVASTFDAGSIVDRLAEGSQAQAGSLHDPVGLASGALLFDLAVAPGGEQTVDILASSGPGLLPSPSGSSVSDWVTRQQDSVAASWRQELGRVSVTLPPAGQAIADTLRSALAQILVSRDGARLQPGTHSYARSWIRDGAMMAEALLRMGHAREAEDFVRWYAQQQFVSGKVPCCVDRRGPDPIAENDSNGEFIFAVAELYRYTNDRDELAALWPHVDAAARYMETLRQSERTAEVRADHPERYGLLPASISHEGYWAKPMHSYWDDFWALKGYKDAAFLAQVVGDGPALARLERARDEFRTDLTESIRLATGQHRVDFIPGAAELGDFDPTSTTIALAPVGELASLPRGLIESTFERYWRETEQRRLGQRAWDDYTPYELRAVATFVRLGWRERAHQLLDFLLAGRRPPLWNQWAEVVGREPRQPRFVGDMPHAWIASDFIASALDLFAYERESDRSLVLAAGIPAAWLDAGEVAVRGLRTTCGTLSYRIGRDAGGWKIAIDPSIRIPPGGIVIEWPGPQPRDPVRINGQPAAWEGNTLRIRSL